MPVDQIPATTPGWSGIDVLARKPDAQVLAVLDLVLEDARTMFPGFAVVGYTGIPKPDMLKGRAVVIWPAADEGERLAESLVGTAAKVALISREHHFLAFKRNPRQALAYARANMRRFEVNGHDPATPQAPQVAVEPVAAPENLQAQSEVITQAPKAKRARRERTEGTSWADFGLILNDDGIPLATLDNCVRVIEHHPDIAGHLWFDVFLAKIVHEWNVDSPREWSDYDDIRLALFLQRDIGIPRVSSKMASEAVIGYAHREKRNCAYDWMDSLQWDGRERLSLLATLGFGAESTDYTSAVCRNLILSMVKRVFHPGCKSDYMPVFEGEQGKGKSQALEIIGGAWYAELHMDWNGKDFYDALNGKMLLEIGELHAFKQSDVDRIKGIVSCPKDRYRPSYGRHTQDFPRHCVFAGTTNRDDWNRDDTGARRFWPIVCGTIDHAWIRANREQLFAEAVHVIRSGGSYWEVPWGEAQVQQDERRAPDTWDDPVLAWLIGRNKVTLGEVMAGAVSLDSGHQTLSDQQRMGRVMKKLGWIKRNERTNGIQRKVWVNPLALDLPEPEKFEI